VHLRTAMKTRDSLAIGVLRCLLAVLDNAGAQNPAAYPSQVFAAAAEIPRKLLTEHELEALIEAELQSRRNAVIEYEGLGRAQDAARLREELMLIRRYLAA
jgi:uncharacterized protein